MKIKLIVELDQERREKVVDIGPEYDGKDVDSLINDDEIDGMLLEHVWDYVCARIEIVEGTSNG